MALERQSTEAYLLGMAMSALHSVQEHLIQGNDKEALSVVNEAVRSLNDKVQKHFYDKPEGNKDDSTQRQNT